MKTMLFVIVTITVAITLYPNTVFADISKSIINVNDTIYDITFNAERVNVNAISPNLHSYIHNSLDMNITSDKQYNGSLTLTVAKDVVANVFCITRSDVDNHLQNNAFQVRVDNNPRNFTTSTTDDDFSLTFGIPAGSTNATIVNQFVGMALSPMVYFKGIPQTGAYRPGQDVIFNGTLVDACGRHLGKETVYFTAEQLNVTKKTVSDTQGKFSLNFTIPENIEFGNYTSKFEMYEYNQTYNLIGLDTLYLDVGTTINSPRKQVESGISANNVKCGQNFQLIMKSEDGSPACVKPDDMGLLILLGWALESPNHTLVYHIKPNSTAQIFVEYDSRYVNETTILHPRIIDGKTSYQIPPSNVLATVNSESVPANSNSIVTYTVTTNATRGVYWLSVDMCKFIPIAVDVEKSEITSSDLQLVTSGWRCPVSFLDYHVVNVSNATVEYMEN